MTKDTETGRGAGPGALRAFELRIHEPLLRAIGLELAELDGIVTRMFASQRRDAVSYWLQLLLSMGISTLGLALGSTAVVIGAMLIAPLMGPIVQLGMAVVVGSAALVVRSVGRTLGSIAAVVGGAALLTMALPFHELNAEITSRTFPTALDLLIAIFVALAAVLTTVRSSSETASAAAGTAIGIALVPPLCVMGLGLGIADLRVAGGASLLFVTNLSAILFVSVVSFWALGFETVSAVEWDEATLRDARAGRFTLGAMRALQSVFGSRHGRVVRVAVPALLVAVVSFPLAQALDQVAWEVRSRNAVSRIVDRATSGLNTVQTTVSVTGGAVGLQMYVVGSADTAAALERRLDTEIAAATGVDPSIRVIAVPDQGVLRQVTASAAGPADAAIIRLSETRAEIRRRLDEVWPGEQLGAVASWSVEFPDSAAPEVVIRHHGPPAGAAVDALLGRSLSERLEAPVRLRTMAYPREGASEPADRATEWLPAFVRALDVARGDPRTLVCVVVPAAGALDSDGARVAELVGAELRSAPAGRASLRVEGDRWSVRLATEPCEPPEPSGSVSGSAPPGPRAPAAR